MTFLTPIKMSNHTVTHPPTKTPTINVLQLNTRRSSTVIHSLLNDPCTLRFHFLLIQEPYIYPSTSLPIAHASWTPFLAQIPTGPVPACPEDTTVKSMIYANRSIPTTATSSLPTLSNCITAVDYAIPGHMFTLISAYAPPKQAHKLQDLKSVLKAHPHHSHRHVLIGMDCNLHHPLWNPPTYFHTHREAADLIDLMTESGLNLRSQCGVPTFYPPPPNNNHRNTTIDLTWISPV